jgi:hypothetical protein
MKRTPFVSSFGPDSPSGAVLEDYSKMAERPKVPYYTIPNTGIEMIDFIRANLSVGEFQAFLLASAEEYLWRFDKKGSHVADLDKALVYVRWLKDSVHEDGCQMGRWALRDKLDPTTGTTGEGKQANER